jgi:phage terminase large subunit-like protein
MQRRHIFIAMTVVVLAALAWFVSNLLASARVGAAAMAKVSCSCVFVESRDLQECRKDNPPGFDGVAVSVDPAKKSVTGSVLGIVHRTATYTADYGCTLEP